MHCTTNTVLFVSLFFHFIQRLELGSLDFFNRLRSSWTRFTFRQRSSHRRTVFERSHRLPSLRYLIHLVGRSTRRGFSKFSKLNSRVRIRGYTWQPDIQILRPTTQKSKRTKYEIDKRNSDFIRRRVDLIKCVIGSDLLLDRYDEVVTTTTTSENNSKQSTPSATIRTSRDYDYYYYWEDKRSEMPQDGGGRGESADGGVKHETKSGATMKSRYRKYRRYIIESRQEISSCLKYILFLANFIFWVSRLPYMTK